MQSTIAIFEHLYKNIPPLFPPETKRKMEHALIHLKGDQTVSIKDVESTMIFFGYELWPWNQAYREHMALAESKVGEHFLLPRLSQELQKKYHEFRKYGGTMRELHSGQPAAFFTSEERQELCVKLVEMQFDLRDYAAREITSTGKKHYLERVAEFKKLLKEIKQTLDHLRHLADNEQDHPSLADEIRSRVEHFEHGLCSLAPELEYHAVCESIPFFKGRKDELNHMRGINVPIDLPRIA